VALDAAAFVLYVAWRRRHPLADGPRRRAWRSAALAAALVVLVSSIDLLAAARTQEAAHMVAHLVVAMVLAPLATLAFARTPVTVTRRRWFAFLESPVVAFVAFTALVPLSHLTSFDMTVMNHPDELVAELVVYGLVGVAFWRHVLGSTPLPRLGQRVLYLGLGVPVSAFSGLVMVAQTRSAMGPVSDVHQAGWVMIFGGSGLMALEAVVLVASWVTNERRRTASILRAPHVAPDAPRA
jgi:cytochrome c oxidase assembly factor CtaG